MSGTPRGCSGQLGNQGFRCCPGGADLCIYGQKSQKDALGTHGNYLASSPRAGCPQLSPTARPRTGMSGSVLVPACGKAHPQWSAGVSSSFTSPSVPSAVFPELCLGSPHHVLAQLCRGVTGTSSACPGTPQISLPLLWAFAWLLPHQPEVLMQLFQSLQSEPAPVLS